MTQELGFRLAALALLVIVFGISSRFRLRAEREGGALDRSQGGRVLVLLRLIGLAAILPLLLYIVNPAWVAWARMPVPDWLRWLAAAAGFALIPAFLALFRAIGRNISPRETTRAGHALVTDGPYRYVRHPLYSYGLLFYLLLAVVTALWWLLAVAAVAWAVLVWRMGREEANLVAQFGDEYRRYMARTGRFVPRLR
jgi:protein-S-isoprenylcysteine O-methyltransferase Ste14